MKFMDKAGQSSISNLADQLLQDLSIERVSQEEVAWPAFLFVYEC